MADAFDAGDAVFDGLGDLRFKFRGRCAELRHGDGNDRNIGIRQPRDRRAS